MFSLSVRALFLIRPFSMNAEFFGAAGARSTNVSSAGLSSSGAVGRENAAEGSKEKRHKQVNENRREYRQQNRSPFIFVVPKAFGIAWLGEHNVSRRHESGFSIVRKKLGLGLSQLKAGTLSQHTGADNPRSRTVHLPSLTLSRSCACFRLSAHFFPLSFRAPKAFGVEESLAITDFRQAKRA